MWREERGITQNPQAILFYSPNATILGKLRGVLHLHQLRYLEPSPNAILVAADTQLLGLGGYAVA